MKLNDNDDPRSSYQPQDLHNNTHDGWRELNACCWEDDSRSDVVKIILIHLLPKRQATRNNDENHHDEFMNEPNGTNAYELIEKLIQKMRTVKRRAQPFSMNFELVHTFGRFGVYGTDSHLFHCPFDVKISYSHSCILISDTRNSRIMVFDLHTKEFRTSIPSPSKYPLFLCVEENYDGKNNDALIFGCENFGVYKYDLNELLEKSPNMEACNSIWISQIFVSPQGIVLLSSKR